jgi:hypothetical protein
MMDLSKLSARQQRFAEDRLHFFTGIRRQCVRAWFNDIETVATMVDLVDDSVLLKYAVQNLLDASERWYKQNQSKLTTWSDFKQGMIARFEKGSKTNDMNASLQSEALMKERRRTIAWHPQHVAHYRSYHGSKSSSTGQTTNFSLPPTSLFELDPFEAPWPNGPELWHIHEIRSQRQSFANRIDAESLMITPPIAIVPHEILPVVSEVHFEPPLPPTYPIEPNSPTTYSIASNLLESRSSFNKLAVKHRTHLHVPISTGDSVPTFRRPTEPPTIWYTSKPHQHLLQSVLHSQWLTDSSSLLSLSSKSGSRDYSRRRFLRRISTYLAQFSLFLLSILFRFGITHLSVHNLDDVGSQPRTKQSTFLVDMALSTYPRSSIKTLTPYVITIETLRALESLLIYNII